MILVTIAIWVGLSIAVGRYAERKGLDRTGYLLLALLLSPLLGLVFAALAKPNLAKAEVASLSTGTLKKCPYCAELVKREAVLCRYCGREFTRPLPAAPAPADTGTGLFGRQSYPEVPPSPVAQTQPPIQTAPRFRSRAEYEVWKKANPVKASDG